jgi:hypothetical protein
MTFGLLYTMLEGVIGGPRDAGVGGGGVAGLIRGGPELISGLGNYREAILLLLRKRLTGTSSSSSSSEAGVDVASEVSGDTRRRFLEMTGRGRVAVIRAERSMALW